MQIYSEGRGGTAKGEHGKHHAANGIIVTSAVETIAREERGMLIEMARRVWMVLREESGVETLEWILIGGLIVGVGIALYPGVLQPGLTGVIGTITGKISGAV